MLSLVQVEDTLIVNGSYVAIRGNFLSMTIDAVVGTG
jgi:hypothetical protein